MTQAKLSVALAAMLFATAAQTATPTPAPAPAQSPAPAARPQAAPPPAIARTDLQRHDLSVAGHEAIQTRVDFAPGAVAPRHRHPGEEIVFILRGTLEYRLDGSTQPSLASGEKSSSRL
jgi:quercetin dioxygenase-like cupin family protein